MLVNAFQRALIDPLKGFLFIGCITTCTDIFLLWVLTDLLSIWYLVSAGFSYCISSVLSYGLNKSFNYKNGSNEYLKQASTFLCIAAGSLFLNLCIISLCVEEWSLNYLYAKIIATGVAFFLNFLGQSLVTFRVWR
ncbi:MAG: GtrA family protein [Methanobacteriota archaeon]